MGSRRRPSIKGNAVSAMNANRESGACDRSTMGEALAEPGITVAELTRGEAH